MFVRACVGAAGAGTSKEFVINVSYSKVPFYINEREWLIEIEGLRGE